MHQQHGQILKTKTPFMLEMLFWWVKTKTHGPGKADELSLDTLRTVNSESIYPRPVQYKYIYIPVVQEKPGHKV